MVFASADDLGFACSCCKVFWTPQSAHLTSSPTFLCMHIAHVHSVEASTAREAEGVAGLDIVDLTGVPAVLVKVKVIFGEDAFHMPFYRHICQPRSGITHLLMSFYPTADVTAFIRDKDI